MGYKLFFEQLHPIFDCFRAVNYTQLTISTDATFTMQFFVVVYC